MSRKPLPGEMSRRERQIMDIVYQRSEASAADVASELPDRPGYSTVRKLMSILEGKGYLYHDREKNNRYIYHPTISAEQASESALANIMDTFFKGSAGRAAIALLKRPEADISEEEKETIIRLIEASRLIAVKALATKTDNPKVTAALQKALKDETAPVRESAETVFTGKPGG